MMTAIQQMDELDLHVLVQREHRQQLEETLHAAVVELLQFERVDTLAVGQLLL